MSELPGNIPLFPLPNLVLFPGIEVPLHIFEPRYRQMLADIREGRGVIGRVLLKGNWERDYYGNPEIFSIGCAGTIEQIEGLPDGRFNLILSGLSEFRVLREVGGHPYRQAEVRWCPPPMASLELDDEAMVNLHELLVSHPGKAAWEGWEALVRQRGLRGADMINFLCFHLDLNPLEKQTLLEALNERVGRLIDVLTFKLEERKLGPRGQGGSGIVQ